MGFETLGKKKEGLTNSKKLEINYHAETDAGLVLREFLQARNEILQNIAMGERTRSDELNLEKNSQKTIEKLQDLLSYSFTVKDLEDFAESQ